MKKFFRMASVIALACASLTYTSCTKDYSEEINALNKDVAALQSKHDADIASLSGEISSLKSSLSSLESAYKAADAVLKTATEANAAAIADLQKKIEAAEAALAEIKATAATKEELASAKGELDAKVEAAVAALQEKIDATNASVATLKEEMLAKATALEAELLAVQTDVDEFKAFVEEALANINALYAELSNSLRSLVFIPDLYFAGIEATEYTFTSYGVMEYKYYKNSQKEAKVVNARISTTTSASTDETTKITLAAGQPNSVGYVKDKDGITISKQLGETAIANYHLNPSSFNVEAAEWALYGADYRYITRAEDAPELTWAPVFDSIESVDGVAEVSYHIENPFVLLASIDTSHSEREDWLDGVVPVMRLEATLEEGKTITSDYEAIVPVYEYLDHLAFAQTNDYKACHCSHFDDFKYLYDSALCTDDEDYGGAIVAYPSITWVYNAGDLDLNKLISVHMRSYMDGAYELTLDELNAKYDGNFSITFDNVVYTVGENTTSEDMYAILNDGVLTPAHVKTGAKPTSVANGVGDKSGVSSIGRQPVIRVTLWHGEDILDVGFFKIEYVEKVVKTEVDIPNLGKVPYICESVNMVTNWHQFSDLVLEQLGLSYAEFKEFTIEKEADGVVVYVNNDGKFEKTVVTEWNTDGTPKVVKTVSEAYGPVTYNDDKDTHGVNDAFTWAVYPRGVDEGKTQTVWVHFYKGEFQNIYVSLTVSVAEKPNFIFGKKIANEWYTGVVHCDVNEPNTVLMNVLVPVATVTTPVVGGDVKDYYRNLNHYLVGHEPSVELVDSDPIYEQIAAGKYTGAPATAIDVNVEYSFSEKQPEINGVQLVINEAANKLYAAKYNDKDEIEYDDEKKTQPTCVDDNLIAWINALDELWYNNDTDIAKELLNLWSYKETDPEKMLYANIDVALTYGTCGLPAGDDHFHVRFVRPLHFEVSHQDTPEESQVDGANIPVVKFLKESKDWNNQPVIMDSLDNKGNTTGNLIEAVIKSVNMYEFYGISELKIDLKNAVRDNVEIGAPENLVKLSEATPSVQLSVGTVNTTTGVFTADASIITDGIATIDIADFDNLKKYVINYKNNAAVVEAFTIKIPVSYKYFWGVINSEFIINVKKTSETGPGI